TTFFAIMFGLTYLSVDPILKAAYALRCFCGQSLQSGEDLKAELRQQRVTARSASLLVALLILMPQALPAHPQISSAASPIATSNLSATELDRAIEQVLEQQKYTWRM